MSTTIKEFASAFETTSRNVMLLLLSDPNFFREQTNISIKDYNNIELSNKAIDKLEDLITNQKDKLELSIQSVCQLLYLSIEEMELYIKAYKAIHKGERINRTTGCIKYTTLISILDDAKIKNPNINIQFLYTDDNTESESSSSEASDITLTTPASKTKRKKKSKYAATKNDILNLVSNETFITEIRIFLLDSGEYDAKELAIMSDMDILSTYNKTYATLQSKNGTVIIKMDALYDIINHIYYIDNDQ